MVSLLQTGRFVVARFCGVREEIRRNTLSKTSSKNPECDLHYRTSQHYRIKKLIFIQFVLQKIGRRKIYLF